MLNMELLLRIRQLHCSFTSRVHTADFFFNHIWCVSYCQQNLFPFNSEHHVMTIILKVIKLNTVPKIITVTF